MRIVRVQVLGAEAQHLSHQAAEVLVQIRCRGRCGVTFEFERAQHVTLCSLIGELVDLAAQFEGRFARPARRQQCQRQLRIMQLHAPERVDRQGADDKSLLRVQLGRGFQQFGQRGKRLNELRVVGAERVQFPTLQNQFAQRLCAGKFRLHRVADQYTFFDAQAHQHFFQRRRVDAGVRKNAGRDHAKAFGREFAPQVCALFGGDGAGAGNHQSQPAVPGLAGRGVDASVGALKTRCGARIESVLAASTHPLRTKPPFFGQPKHTGAHQSVVDAEGRHQRNQATQPDVAAVRGDDVAKHGHDHRLGAGRAAGHVMVYPSSECGNLSGGHVQMM